MPETQACRLMVGLLDLSGNDGCEAALAQRLAVLLAAGETPDLEDLQQEMAPAADTVPDRDGGAADTGQQRLPGAATIGAVGKFGVGANTFRSRGQTLLRGC